ncbi:MAG: hypothetical protein C4520_04180 [Candidatus Abyssobacteria bacterium SURF_5]|uniref:PD(D/E)XK endonuclease domain-containing protein n=1 Tax=Abyssobacteria bacterium (strain SURF_5) TaxID=2093360 RepID=A0A3A4NV00_ABYX5|nr:MAG: hypothetical protein C4520_04180 [Candidatus Abyssubacteria bacterium SURF_5]
MANTSLTFGKVQEFLAVAELLRRRFKVYLTLVDDSGIDCVLRLKSGCYVDVQIKARSRNAKYPYTFAGLKFAPRSDLFFIFYTEINNQIAIIPSRTLARLASRNKSGENEGTRTFTLPKRTEGRKFLTYSRFIGDNGFNLIREYSKKH